MGLVGIDEKADDGITRPAHDRRSLSAIGTGNSAQRSIR
jgi:hypothetical protein